MLEHCAMSYTIAEYRKWTTDDSGQHMDEAIPPFTPHQLQTLVTTCQEEFLQAYKADGEARIELIGDILQNWSSQEMQIVRFEDGNQEKELVHAIAVEPALRRITLVFRGSVTQQDFITDIKALQVNADISGRGLPGCDQVKVHQGFYEYLFGKRRTTSSNADQDGSKDGKSSYETILVQLREVFADYPGYDLYVTGHSLGGALCTLFSVFFCTEPDQQGLPEQVSCFSYASPKVGTQGLQRLMHKAEMEGKLRFLRGINHKDPITNVPKDVFLVFQADVSCGILMNTLCQKNMYRHCGVELRCYPQGQGFTLSHLPDDRWSFRFCPLFCSDFLKTMTRFFSLLIIFIRWLLCFGEKFRKYHSWLVYFERMDANKEALDELYLDDLYEAIKDNDFSLVKKRY